MWEWGGVVNFSWRDAAELVTFLLGTRLSLRLFSQKSLVKLIWV